MKLPRRKFLHLTAGAAVPAISQIARAQTYPTHISTIDPPHLLECHAECRKTVSRVGLV
jgi:hypothetical protein